METRLVPVMFLSHGYYAILSDQQRHELADMMRRYYRESFDQSKDTRVYWIQVTTGSEADRWRIIADGQETGSADLDSGQ